MHPKPVLVLLHLMRIACFVGLLGGCAIDSRHTSFGSPALEAEDLASLERQFEVGKATSKDVQKKLGPPASKAKSGTSNVWVYEYTVDKLTVITVIPIRSHTRKQASFFFDSGTDVLQKIDYASSTP